MTSDHSVEHLTSLVSELCKLPQEDGVGGVQVQQ